MKFFEKYTSNTTAGSTTQRLFKSDGQPHTGRVFYKVFAGGEYEYAFLFTNITDSTFADGEETHRNQLGDSWDILRMRVAVCDEAQNNIPETAFHTLTFKGLEQKEVNPGEFFCTDGVRLNAKKDQYLCVETVFCGEWIPYHHESVIASYLQTDNGWDFTQFVPFASMVGCDRPVKQRIAYWGDSITQGCGTDNNSYTHWNAVLSELLGEENAYWNIGIGYARANDAATDGAWMFKAKHNDVAIVCLGTNDMMRHTEDQTRADLLYIVTQLKQAGVKVIVQTLPPFGYEGEYVDKWKRLNAYIKTDLAKVADLVTDVVPSLWVSEELAHMPKYDGHPNAEGCRVWARELYKQIKDFLK